MVAAAAAFAARACPLATLAGLCGCIICIRAVAAIISIIAFATAINLASHAFAPQGASIVVLILRNSLTMLQSDLANMN